MKGKKGNIAIVIIGSMILLCLLGYNVYAKGKVFFEASIYQIISLMFALLITFFLTQMKNDERRKLDMLDKMLIDIQKDLNDENILKFETEDERSMALLHQKSVANRLKYLVDNNLFPELEEEIKYIDNEIGHLRDMYGEHMTDMEYMRKSKKQFTLYITNVEDKIFLAHLKLFK